MVRSAPHEVAEGQQYQLTSEILIWKVDVANKATTPATPSVVEVRDLTKGTDVTATVMPGAASVSGTVITLPALKLLTALHVYRVLVQWTESGNTRRAYFVVECPF